MNTPSVRPREVVIGTYNVKDMYGSDPKGEGIRAEVKSARALAAVAHNIEQSGADIVALQEVESKPVLDKFLKQYLPQFSYSALVDGNDRRGIDVAVISKFPITQVVSHKDLRFNLPEGYHFKDGTNTTNFQRDALRVDIDLGGYPLSVYTTHLKMGGSPVMEAIRQAEAGTLRTILKQEMGDFSKAHFVVTGDMNANPDRKSIQVLQGSGDDALVSSLDSLPQGVNRKTEHAGQLDYIFYPQNMQAGFQKARISPDPVASDHSLVTARFRLGD